jgi:hypothetical protein
MAACRFSFRECRGRLFAFQQLFSLDFHCSSLLCTLFIPPFTLSMDSEAEFQSKDARDMSRMGKVQELKACLSTLEVIYLDVDLDTAILWAMGIDGLCLRHRRSLAICPPHSPLVVSKWWCFRCLLHVHRVRRWPHAQHPITS